MIDDQYNEQVLRIHGWRRTQTGRWTHPELPLSAGRSRAFSIGEALSLLDAIVPNPIYATDNDPED